MDNLTAAPTTISPDTIRTLRSMGHYNAGHTSADCDDRCEDMARRATTTRCQTCTEPSTSQVHRNIDPQAVRGPWDIPHHAYVPTPPDPRADWPTSWLPAAEYREASR